ncbi:GTP cyclohydrolase 1 [Linum perenne]
MGALDEGHFHVVLENGVKLECPDQLGIQDQQPESLDIEDAVKVLLQGLGEDINREGIKKTPIRVAKALREATKGMITAVASILKSLGEDPSREELIGTPSRFVKWLMNFQNASLEMKLNGFVHGRVDPLKANGDMTKEQMQSEVNLSFWSQCEHHLLPFYGVVHIGYFSVQERLTRQIAETVSSLLGGDVIVVVEAGHTCMISRGIEKFGSSTATIAVLGRFSTDAVARAMFLQSLPNSSPALGAS